LFRIELVLILLRLASAHRQPCLALWEDSWNLTPYQKFVILRAYENVSNANIARELPETVVSTMALFSDLRELFPADVNNVNPVRLREALDRILLAIGNHQVEARLTTQQSFTHIVNECKAKRGDTIQTKIVYQVPIQTPRQTTIRYIQPPAQAIVVPKPNPTIVRIATPIPQPARMITRKTIPVARKQTVIVTKPAAPSVATACSIPDRRYLIEGGRALRQGLQWFLETESVTPAQITDVKTLISLSESVERTIKQHSRA
jgi:hypothetical protein